jgi:hypothetical protein
MRRGIEMFVAMKIDKIGENVLIEDARIGDPGWQPLGVLADRYELFAVFVDRDGGDGYDGLFLLGREQVNENSNH